MNEMPAVENSFLVCLKPAPGSFLMPHPGLPPVSLPAVCLSAILSYTPASPGCVHNRYNSLLFYERLPLHICITFLLFPGNPTAAEVYCFHQRNFSVSVPVPVSGRVLSPSHHKTSPAVCFRQNSV